MENILYVLVAAPVLGIFFVILMLRLNGRLIGFLEKHRTRWFTVRSLGRETGTFEFAVKVFLAGYCKAGSVFYRLSEHETCRLSFEERELLKSEEPGENNIMYFEVRYANPFVISFKNNMLWRPGSST